jgi:hypothetical protein
MQKCTASIESAQQVPACGKGRGHGVVSFPRFGGVLAFGAKAPERSPYAGTASARVPSSRCRVGA